MAIAELQNTFFSVNQPVCNADTERFVLSAVFVIVTDI